MINESSDAEKKAVRHLLETIADQNPDLGHPRFIEQALTRTSRDRCFHRFLVLAEKKGYLLGREVRSLAYRYRCCEPHDCLEDVAMIYNMEVDEITGLSKSNRAAEARIDACYLLRYCTGLGVEAITEILERRAHRSVNEINKTILRRLDEAELMERYLNLGSGFRKKMTLNVSLVKDPLWAPEMRELQDTGVERRAAQR